MSRSLSDDVLEATIQALSATSGDALAKAAAEGFPDRSEVVEWSDRMLGLVLQQRDRSALRARSATRAARLIPSKFRRARRPSWRRPLRHDLPWTKGAERPRFRGRNLPDDG